LPSAVARGFAKAGDSAAAVTFVVKTVAGMVDRLATLRSADAATINGRRIPFG
jgi:hypothetical protein